MLGCADLSLFAFFSVVYCLTWFVVAPSIREEGKETALNYYLPKQGQTSFTSMVRSWFKCNECTHVCTHIYTLTCMHRRAPQGTYRERLQLDAAGVAKGYKLCS